MGRGPEHEALVGSLSRRSFLRRAGAAAVVLSAWPLVARAGDLGLPARPAGLQPGVPPENVGERVIPPAAPSPRPPRKRRRRRRNPHRKAPTRR